MGTGKRRCHAASTENFREAWGLFAQELQAAAKGIEVGIGKSNIMQTGTVLKSPSCAPPTGGTWEVAAECVPGMKAEKQWGEGCREVP